MLVVFSWLVYCMVYESGVPVWDSVLGIFVNKEPMRDLSKHGIMTILYLTVITL